MSELTTLKVALRTLHFFYFSGVVEARSDSSHTTTTYEQGSNRVLRSDTTHKCEVVVRAADDQTHVVNTAAAKMYLAKGSTVTLVLATTSETGDQSYVAIHDHSSGKTGFFAKGVNDVAGPPLYNMGIILAVFVGGFSLLSLSGTSIVLVGLCDGFFYELYRQRKIVRAHAEAVIAKFAK